MRVIKIGVFVLAFLVGTFSVWAVSSVVFYGVYVPVRALMAPEIVFPDAEPIVSATDTRSGIHVAYAGWDAAEDDKSVPTLKFLIHNGTRSPISYFAHSAESPSPTVTVDGGEPRTLYGCGTGIKTYYILPGTSALVRVTNHSFIYTASPELVKTGTNFTVGFHLNSVTENSKVHFSPTFTLPKKLVYAFLVEVSK